MKSDMSIRTARKWVRAFGICAVIAALMPALFGTITAAVVCVTLVLFFLAAAVYTARRWLRCPHCGRALNRNDGAFCQFCGQSLEPEKEDGK